MIKLLPSITIFLSLISVDVYACKKFVNRPHVSAMDEGIFYSKSIPSSHQGSKGITKVYKVGIQEDEVVDSYNWYSQRTIVLSWSPIKGEVAVLKYNPEDEKSTLSFYIGGQHLKTYTHNDLKLLGARIPTIHRHPCSLNLDIEIIGQEQIPGTNEYVYKVNFLSSGDIKLFDITTGLQVHGK